MITIDATSALAQGGGIGRLTRGLLLGLAEVEQQRPITLLVARGSPAPTLAMPSNYRWRRSPLSFRESAWLWHRVALPIPADALLGSPALFHSPDYTLPPLRHARGIVTVHDLSYEEMPDVHVPSLRRFLQRAVPHSVARADRVFADSQSTKDAIVRCYGTAPEKISVVYPAIEPRFRPFRHDNAEEQAQIATVRQRYEVEGRFILGLGTMEPRKNFSTLIEAYADYRARFGGREMLVLAGGGGWLNQREALQTRVAALGLTEHVRFTGFVPDEDLPTLINAARLMVYPSLYEGFGFPVLEALACGVPTITSRNSSLPEAGGEAARYLDEPRDSSALAEAMATLLSDEREREQRIAAGLAHAAAFTWAVTARRALTLYDEVLLK